MSGAWMNGRVDVCSIDEQLAATSRGETRRGTWIVSIVYTGDTVKGIDSGPLRWQSRSSETVEELRRIWGLDPERLCVSMIQHVADKINQALSNHSI